MSCTGNIGSVLLVTSAYNLCNEFDPDQAPHFVGTDRGPKFFQHTTKNMKYYRPCRVLSNMVGLSLKLFFFGNFCCFIFYRLWLRYHLAIGRLIGGQIVEDQNVIMP